MAKRNVNNDNEGSGVDSCKIPRMNEQDRRFDFPSEPELLPEEMVVAKHSLDRLPSYIPFRAAGNGTVFIQRRLLVQLYEKEPNVKLKAGVWVEMPRFPNLEEGCSYDEWKDNREVYWKTEIGSFLHAFELIGEPKKCVVSPHWYISVNWASLKTICTISDIAHDAYIQEYIEEEYEWHLDSELPRFKFRTEESSVQVVTDSVKLIELNFTDNYKIPVGQVNTSIWQIDSEINYWHLQQNEADKVYPSYYEYSSDDLQDQKHEVSNEREYEGDYKHGTKMCKTMCAIASNQTSIHFVKCPKLMNNANHILQSLNYIIETANKLHRKWNIVLMTLGSKKFRCRNDQSLLYVKHQDLHQQGFLFICSAGNVTFPANNATPLTQIPEYPLSFFLDCASCVVVGAHAYTSKTMVCVTTKFESSGCCTPDKKSGQSFKQGVHTWAIGENVVLPKTKHQENDSVCHGTCVASAVVAASATYFVPKLLTPLQYIFGNKLILSKKFKELLELTSDIFVCSKHGTRKLIFNPKNIMEKLKYQQIE